MCADMRLAQSSAACLPACLLLSACLPAWLGYLIRSFGCIGRASQTGCLAQVVWQHQLRCCSWWCLGWAGGCQMGWSGPCARPAWYIVLREGSRWGRRCQAHLPVANTLPGCGGTRPVCLLSLTSNSPQIRQRMRPQTHPHTQLQRLSLATCACQFPTHLVVLGPQLLHAPVAVLVHCGDAVHVDDPARAWREGKQRAAVSSVVPLPECQRAVVGVSNKMQALLLEGRSCALVGCQLQGSHMGCSPGLM